MTRIADHKTNLSPEFQLPHPADLADSPTEQVAKLELRAIRILRDLSTKAETAKERLEDAKSRVDSVFMAQVDQMIASGQLPAMPGVIRDICQATQMVAEKTAKNIEAGLQLVKVVVTPTGMNTAITTLIYIDPKMTSIEVVKEHMLNSLKESNQAVVQSKQRSYDDAKSLVNMFHKHYVSRMSQVTNIADLFKTAKEI